ncbi:MAG TPA: ester cyclase [Roseiflexaceae bacterium]
MTAEEHKALVRRYLEDVWSKGNTDVIDDVLSPNYTLRVLQGSSGHEDRALHGPQGVKQSVDLYHRAFSDLQITPQTIVAEGDRVVVEWTAHATHSGAFRGIAPTGKQLLYAAITIYRVEGGKIAEEVYLGDRLGLWQQLGLVPDSPKLAAEIGRD